MMGCWVDSSRSTDSNGYASGQQDGVKMRAHVWSYTLFKGPVPAGCVVHHQCGNKACYNPRHLELLTYKEHAAEHYRFTDHCPNGHEYTEDNTYLTPEGWRQCVKCKRERQGYKGGVKNLDKTHCVHGHEFTSGNTRIRHDGGRECRACEYRRGAERRARKRG